MGSGRVPAAVAVLVALLALGARSAYGTRPSAQFMVVAPSPHVTANVGQDVVLHCHLFPSKNARSLDIRWFQNGSAGFVHHYQNGLDLEQMEEYKGRTELLRNGLSNGNLSLLITAVSFADIGSYICSVQDDDDYTEAVVELEVSDPFSQIVQLWKVALAVVVTLLVGSFVIIAILLRKNWRQRSFIGYLLSKKEAQSREHRAESESFQPLPPTSNNF